jgi:hypothetical protein
MGSFHHSSAAFGRFCDQRSQRKLIAVLLILIVAAVAPAEADATPGYLVHPGGLTIVLPVEKNAGYVISVSANQRQRVRLAFEKPSSGIDYSTRGHISSHRVDANFGTLGQIHVGLHIVRQSSDPPREGNCKGRGTFYQEGSYRGAIELNDVARGVPLVSVKDGRVYLIRRFRQVCRRQHSRREADNNEQKTEASVLTVTGQVGGREINLQAFNLALIKNASRSKGYLSAIVSEWLERVRITRRVDTPINHESFTLSPRGRTPETADLKLAKPFNGRATYLFRPGARSSWSGDLSLEFPDIGDVPLIGPGFDAILCRTVSAITRASCSHI